MPNFIHHRPARYEISRRRAAGLRRRPVLELMEGRQLLSTFTVSNAGDSGAGSLRQAIINSDSTPSTPANPNIINFSYLGGVMQIQLASQLPTITQAVTIDGTTKSGYTGATPKVQLLGNDAGSALGLDIAASGTTVKALAIDAFSAGGVLVDNASNVAVENSYVGISPANNATGTDVNLNTIREGNGVYGVTIQSENGGESTGDVLSNDVVSANTYNGIILSGSGTTGNVVSGTIIGSDNTGKAVVDDPGNLLGNGQAGGGGSGVVINGGASRNTIGGTTAAARDVIVGNKSFGVYITDAGTNGNVVDGDTIGADITGTTITDGSGGLLGNGQSGVGIVAGASNNVVSGTLGAPEVISGNAEQGVLISDYGTSFNVVQGVEIGTDVNATTALPNGVDGVLITNQADYNTIGGTTLVTNVISGNASNGVELTGGAVLNTVSANLIGTNGTGTVALPNRLDGVHIGNNAEGNVIGSTTATYMNVISGNGANGVTITDPGTASNVVEDNFIGTSASGTSRLANAGDGVLIGNAAVSNTVGAGNVISGNGTWGVYITGTGTTSNVVEGDYIGTDSTGKVALPNANNGVDIVYGATANTVGGSTAAARNIISGNLNEGVLIGFAGTSKNVVEGNYIGTNAAGTVALPNGLDGVYVGLGSSNNSIGGGANSAAWNVISGNRSNGVLVTDSQTSGTTIAGNSIGTNAAGTAALPNGGNGVCVAAGTSGTLIGAFSSFVQLNVISGNLSNGVYSAANSTIVSFSEIGTNVSGQISLPNGSNGLLVSGAATDYIEYCPIQNNLGYGVLTDNGSSIPVILGDSIYANALGGISEIGNPALQPAPLLASVTVAGTQLTVTGSLSGASPTKSGQLAVNFFASPYSSSPASIQGKSSIGSLIVTTNSNGNATFTTTFTPSSPVAPGQIITATVDDVHTLSTSQFGNAVTVPSSSATFLGTDAKTQGAWGTAYGADGYDIAADSSAANPKLPSYATLSLTGTTPFVWAATTTDPRALENAAGTGHIASTWYTATTMSFNLNLTDGKSHEVSLYAVDWSSSGRSEQVQVLDAATGIVLSSQTLSSFQGGDYLSWTLSGNVVIKVTNLNSNSNAVVSGIFFGGKPASTVTSSASFLGTDTKTQGAWRTAYGADGYDIAADTSGVDPKLPSYATLSLTGETPFVWAATTTDPRALENAAGTGHIASTWYTATTMSFNLNLTDGKAHKVSLYAVDWSGSGRSELVQVIDAATGTVLDSRTISSFQGGEYLSWQISGNVVIKVTNLNSSSNAVVSGLFFG